MSVVTSRSQRDTASREHPSLAHQALPQRSHSLQTSDTPFSPPAYARAYAIVAHHSAHQTVVRKNPRGSTHVVVENHAQPRREQALAAHLIPTRCGQRVVGRKPAKFGICVSVFSCRGEVAANMNQTDKGVCQIVPGRLHALGYPATKNCSVGHSWVGTRGNFQSMYSTILSFYFSFFY